MTILKVPTNTELRSLPFARKAGYSPYRSNMDGAGRVQNIATFGDAQVSIRNADISMNFHHGFFADQLNIVLAGGGVLDNDKSMFRSTVTNAGDSTTAETKAAILYQAGFDSQILFTAAFTKDESDADYVQYIGAGDDEDGYFLGAHHGHLMVFRKRNGIIEDEIHQHEFIYDQVDGKGVSGFNLDLEKMNAYRIQWGYLGVIPAVFEVYGGLEKGWIPLHAIDKTNAIIDTTIGNPHLSIHMHCEIISGTPDVPIVLRTASWYGGSIGGRREPGLLSFFAAKTATTIVGGIDTPVISIRNKTTFRADHNHLFFDLAYMSYSADGNKNVAFDHYVNSITDGLETYTDVDTNFSITEYAQSPINITTLGRYIGTIFLEKVGHEYIQVVGDEARLNPGDSLQIVARSANASDIEFTARWGEAR